MNEITQNEITQLGRRGFLGTVAAVAGGFSLGWNIPAAQAAITPPAITPSVAAGGHEVGIWAVVLPDDTVVVRIARSEMGQGTLTGLAQLVADEMDADWSKVRAEYISPEANLANKRAWGDMSTGGSRGIRASVEYVRKGGAAAKAMLIQAAAAQWGVPAGECTAAASVITHTPSGRTVRYGQVAAAAAKLPVPEAVAVKQPSEWKIVGKGVKRLDTVEKLSGKLVYAIDLNLPNMLNAAIAQSPVFGGKLAGFDEAKAKAMPGVRAVVKVDDSTIAVVADKWWQAQSALKAMDIKWDEGANAKVSSATIAEHLRGGLDAQEAFVGLKQGDVDGALKGAAKVVEATYGTPFLNHATLEPMTCTALWDGSTIEVWVSSQNGDASLAAAAEAAGVQLANVKVNKHHLGGGFGRRGQQDYVRQAVLIAKQVPNRPVKLIWSREEDMQHGFYRPITMAKMKAGLDAQGNLVALHGRISGQSILASLLPQNLQNGMDPATFQGVMASGVEAAYGYNVPNLLVDHAMRNPHITAGFWRGVNVNQNAVYMECFMDELAEAAGQDPLAFRLKVLKPKWADVLKAAADKAGYGKPLPAGHFHGIAQVMGYGSYVAGVAEVSVSADGVLKIHKITAATNPGHVVNPAQIERQVAGSFVYGLSAALYGEITVKDGAVEQTNFDSYNMMRIDEMPRVETVLVPTLDFWGGVGEPTIAVAAPAVLNAIAKATGKRVRDLPLMHHELKKGA